MRVVSNFQVFAEFERMVKVDESEMVVFGDHDVSGVDVPVGITEGFQASHCLQKLLHPLKYRRARRLVRVQPLVKYRSCKVP